ncbi:unnamed protein product [Withania somnifera]
MTRNPISRNDQFGIEEQHKKALEEDPSVFDYDGVYDDMKVKAVQPRAQDREERKPKYIQMLIDKAKQREREHEVIYERKIAKERSKDDHLYADKDKFVTAAYKRKLQEQAKWLEEERLRELREERDDSKSKKAVNHHEQEAVQTVEKPSSSADAHSHMSTEIKRQDREASVSRKERIDEVDMKPHSDGSPKERAEKPASDNGPTATPGPVISDQPKVDHHKRSLDAVAAAKERYLARKRVKEQQ